MLVKFKEYDEVAQVKDLHQMLQGPIMRARAKKFKETLLDLRNTSCLDGFVEGEMKEGISHTNYACITIVVHED